MKKYILLRRRLELFSLQCLKDGMDAENKMTILNNRGTFHVFSKYQELSKMADDLLRDWEKEDLK